MPVIPGRGDEKSAIEHGGTANLQFFRESHWTVAGGAAAADNPIPMSDTPKCAKCQSRMEEGFILDLGEGDSKRVAQWVSGPPEPSFWMGLKTKGKHKRQVRTFRCIRCGFLESYAW